VAALVVASLAVVGHQMFRDPEVAFLPPGNDEGWIEFRFPATAGSVRTAQPAPPFVFSRRFHLAALPASARLEAQAIETLELELNGERLVPAPVDAWREPVRLEVGERLREGTNELRAWVRHPMGPGLLRLELRDGDRLLLASDEGWTVAPPGGRAERARFADDTRVHPASLRGPTTGDLLGERWPELAGLLLVGTLLAFVGDGRGGDAGRWLPGATLGAVSLGWGALLVGRLAELPLATGFDAEGHLAYAAYLREHGALPLASEGLSMFHPPLFYGLLAGLTGLLGVEVGEPGAGGVHRLLPVAAGLASVWAVWLAARRIFGDAPLRITLAVAVAGLLPMHVYMSAYVSNESTATLTASALLAATLGVLLAPRLSARACTGLAVLGGLALLAKYSGFVVVPLALGLVALRHWILDARPLPRVVGLGAALGAGALAVGGWPYARNWALLGTPFPWNRDVGGPGLWWHIPGFHTLEFFTRFGESLRRPLFAGFRSHWDGVYSTLWGDGLAAGTTQPWSNPGGWALDWMLLAYPLALPVTALLAVGIVRAVARAARDADAHRRLAWSAVLLVLWAIGLSHLSFAIRYPSYAASKAFYALPALLPLSLVGALGLAWLPERLRGEGLRPVRALYFGALLVLAAVLVLSFRG